MILVPVKKLAGAKQRLAAILDQPARTDLAQAMLLDVLETLAEWPHHPEVGIVTSDPFALQLAHQFHFTVIADNANRGETDAIEIATRFCESQGVESTLVIPGDIPLIQSWELEPRRGPVHGEGLCRTLASGHCTRCRQSGGFAHSCNCSRRNSRPTSDPAMGTGRFTAGSE